MTHPETEVGGATDEPVNAAEPTLEDRFAAFKDEDEQPDDPAPEAAEDEGEAPEAEELTEEDVAEEEADETPPIKPPVSWTAEEQEEFKNLPRALQETLTRRESEREKFVQSKAREAATARDQAERQVVDQLAQLQAQHMQALQATLPQVPPKPAYQMSVDDPIGFAEQMDAHERAVAQHHYVQQQIASVQQQMQNAQRHITLQEQQETQAILQEQFPEYLDPTQGPKLRQELGSIALELGYSADQLSQVDAKDILAMRHVANLKAKAAKYDALMSKKMEKVRSAKDMPKVSRPGVAVGKGAVANQRYAADRNAMQNGDTDAAKRVFGRFV